MSQMLLAAKCQCNHPSLADLVCILSFQSLLDSHLTRKLRAGVSCQAWLYGELFLQCYANLSPVEDVVHCVCKSALMVSMSDVTPTLNF